MRNGTIKEFPSLKGLDSRDIPLDGTGFDLIGREPAAVVGYYLRTMDLGDLKRATQTAREAKNLQGVRDVIQAIHQKIK